LILLKERGCSILGHHPQLVLAYINPSLFDLSQGLCYGLVAQGELELSQALLERVESFIKALMQVLA